MLSRLQRKKGESQNEKFNTPENDVNVGGTPVKKKRGSKRKDVTPDKINISDDNETNHDENCETKETREGTDNKGNDSDHKDERSSHKPRKRGRKSQQYETESMTYSVYQCLCIHVSSAFKLLLTGYLCSYTATCALYTVDQQTDLSLSKSLVFCFVWEGGSVRIQKAQYKALFNCHWVNCHECKHQLIPQQDTRNLTKGR